MLTNEDRIQIRRVALGTVNLMRQTFGVDGVPSERQNELMRELIAVQLAAHMFSAEAKLHLGPRTEALLVCDRAHALYEAGKDRANAALR